MNAPFRIQMDDATFAEIPNKAVPRTVRIKDPTFESRQATEWILIGYSERFLSRNERLIALLQQYRGHLDARDCWNQLTHGQRILYSLTALDGQVKNGGITQFFWNCPDLIFSASDALTALKYSELTTAYEKALETLVGNKEKWIELRHQSSSNPAEFWAPFQATYDLLELDWFDDAYFHNYGPTLINLLVRYVRDNKAEFIEL